jgi:hypothetical protein
MMDEKALTDLTHEIMRQGYSEETASDYAVLLGDTPCRDAAGNILVIDAGNVIATLKPLEFFATD